VPEGDTIFRAAATLNRALQGQVVTRFVSVYPALARVDSDTPLAGRTVDGVESRGKHLLMRFSGDLILRTHMRMSGSWHVYRPGERWQRPRADMRIVVATAAYEAVAFTVPVAEFYTAASLARDVTVQSLGPDLLDDNFSIDEARARLRAAPQARCADALLDQREIAGVGHVFKSEVLFESRVAPSASIASLDDETLARILEVAQRQLRLNVDHDRPSSTARWTTGRLNPDESLFVYGRAGDPCYRCGTPIVLAKDGPDARLTYYCPKCQMVGSSGSSQV
jgi:endonuclease-8